jgi:hypothetical protein
MNEALTKTVHSLQFAAGDLREALAKASAVEALLLYPILERVEHARAMTMHLTSARVSDGKGGAK